MHKEMLILKKFLLEVKKMNFNLAQWFSFDAPGSIRNLYIKSIQDEFDEFKSKHEYIKGVWVRKKDVE